MTKKLNLMTGKKVGFYRNENIPGTIYLYGPIGEVFAEDCITAIKVKDELNKMSEKEITIHLHSNGGDAFEGIAIYNILKQSGKNIVICIDGIAASAASIVAMAGNKIQMPRGSRLMIHNVQTGLFGNAEDFEIVKRQLESANEALKSIYLERFKGIKEDLEQLMNEEKIFSEEEALEYGLIDEILAYESSPITEKERIENKVKRSVDLKSLQLTNKTIAEREKRFAAFVNALSKTFLETEENR